MKVDLRKKWIICSCAFGIFFLTACFRTHSEVVREREEQEMQGSVQESMATQAETLEQLQVQQGRLQGRIEEAEHDRRKAYTQSEVDRKSLEEKIGALAEK